jgi:UDP-3-O-[3-hydroxymyristoyl] glucosamine N-acyltransferase
MIGDGARIAAKSGVIGDVPAGAVVAGYPAQPRARWLRALARLYKQGR